MNCIKDALRCLRRIKQGTIPPFVQGRLGTFPVGNGALDILLIKCDLSHLNVCEANISQCKALYRILSKYIAREAYIAFAKQKLNDITALNTSGEGNFPHV